MAINAQLDTSINVTPSEELEALQAILVAQGEVMSYKDAADISYELLGFFEAFGEENIANEDSDA